MKHLAVAILALTATLSAQADGDSKTALTDELAEITESRGVPAVACLLLRDGEVRELAAAGVRRRGDAEPVTIDDSWHLGSCTKAMTATLCGVFIDRGALQLDTELPKLFPQLKLHADFSDATMRQLLSHHAGLAANPSSALWARLRGWRRSMPKARTLVARRVLAKQPEHEPGSAAMYSNTGYMIAGAALERSGGASWEELVRNHVFDPLEMNSAGFGPPGTARKLDQPRGHTADGEPMEPDATGADNPAALGPAGTVHASLRDWAKFAALHLDGAKEDGIGLSEATLRQLQTPVADGRHALGWICVDQPWSEDPVLWHNGSNLVWYCVAWLAPRERIAILAVCNQGGDAGAAACNDASLALLRRL